MMLPYFQNRKIHFARELEGSQDMNELMEEIKYTTYSGFGASHDDGNDLISQLGAMEILYPAMDIEEPKKRVGRNATGMNAKIWGSQQNNDDDEGTAYDSYA